MSMRLYVAMEQLPTIDPNRAGHPQERSQQSFQNRCTMHPSISALGDAHILIVDDQPDQLRLLIDILRGTGCRISIASDGLQACQRAQALMPDLILMDVRMPRMDGFTACRLLAADPLTCAIPVIFLTVAGALHERLEGFDIGCVDYVVKPFGPRRCSRGFACSSRAKRERPVDTESPFVAGKDDDIIVRAAIRHLARTLNDPPTVEQLARAVGTHESGCHARFATTSARRCSSICGTSGCGSRRTCWIRRRSALPASRRRSAFPRRRISRPHSANVSASRRPSGGASVTPANAPCGGNRNATRRAAARVRDYQLYFAVASTVRSLPNTQTAYDWQPLT